MDLISLSPATKTVALGSAAVEVSGLSLRKLTQLVSAYPDLLGFVAGGTTDIARLIINAPNMALAIFSVGVVGPARPRLWRRWHSTLNDDDLLKAFDNAATGQQIEIIATIVDVTFKGGERAVPFLRSVIGSLVTSTPNSKPEPEPSAAPNESETREEPMPTSSSD
ncbi:MAG TPA: hypothetical protein VK603_18000 [Candidatus Saccharimonadales bacterium]|nr:hypothetical protein [Candidatus Saccharimonadales bacterium]